MALYGDFTTYETMSYFGILHGMSRQRVKQRRKFLLELLELHSKSRTVRTLRCLIHHSLCDQASTCIIYAVYGQYLSFNIFY